ncbi:MAG TPA: PhoH family protein [Candidatus Polarisedimenticolia bacterium]|nr:PhoH family protein [Candidatus Polarisedimenticolia bacterium]
MRRFSIPEDTLSAVFGHFDEHLKSIEKELEVQVAARGAEISVSGDPEKEALAANLMAQLAALVQGGTPLKKGDVEIAIRLLRDNRSALLKDFFAAGRLKTTNGRFVSPKSPNQKALLDAIHDHDLVFVIGPAGTGKTFLAVASAVAHLAEKRVERIILARPAVEAGEKLGFLPGDMAQKVDPYFRPLWDALYQLLDRDRANGHVERGTIEIAPLAFMRGRTLANSFVILDEAQNTTSEQMKMFLTRLGHNSKALITGDVTQVDLPPGRISGLVEARRVVAGVEGVRFVEFDETDVVRHPLVQGIVRAYEAYREAGGEAGAAAAAAADTPAAEPAALPRRRRAAGDPASG